MGNARPGKGSTPLTLLIINTFNTTKIMDKNFNATQVAGETLYDFMVKIAEVFVGKSAKMGIMKKSL